jgi:hypothetical protein
VLQQCSQARGPLVAEGLRSCDYLTRTRTGIAGTQQIASLKLPASQVNCGSSGGFRL